MIITTANLIGTIAFFAGGALLLAELFRKGLSKLSLFAYFCFLVSSILLSSSVLVGAIAIAGLSILFGVLFHYYRKEKRRMRKNRDEDIS